MQDKIKSSDTISMQKHAVRLAVGIFIGFVISSILVLATSGNAVSATAGNAILSVMTYSGFALVIFGYFYRRNRHRILIADFLLGLGIGIILIYYAEAGLDIIPTI